MTTSHTLKLLIGLAAFGIGCSGAPDIQTGPSMILEGDRSPAPSASSSEELSSSDDEEEEDGDQYERQETISDSTANAECDGEMIAGDAVDRMIRLTEVGNDESIYTTYDRIDGIASIFEACGDPWGLFPTTYRHITRRIIQAIDGREIEGREWGEKIVLDFAGRYFANLNAVLTGGEPSYAWEHYYYLADRSDVSRTRAVVVAMVAHLTLDLPHALVAVDSTEDDKNDYFVLGELMIEIVPDFIEDLRYYYDTDAEDILNGFFMGRWVDGAFGESTTITLSYQTIRTKAWNNRWLLEQWWGKWAADSEIYSAFWAIDGVLASLDSANTI